MATQSENPRNPVTLPTDMQEIKVIGLYGISGSGKTTLLNQLKQHLDSVRFSFYEGSELIADIIPGGLEAFMRRGEEDKNMLRQHAIEKVHEDCKKSGKIAIVTGHYSFHGGDDELDVVCTESDLATYTHIIYLNVSSDIIEQRRRNDSTRKRKFLSAAQLREWQKAEMVDLRVLDGDKTLTSQDTGAMFWETVLAAEEDFDGQSPLKEIFGGPLGYSYAAFRQATLRYEEMANDRGYELICQQVAAATVVHPEFLSLLRVIAELAPVGALIVSSGLRRVWEIVIERANLQKTVGIIAGGRIEDDIVVTAATKASIVGRLQDFHQKRVWAFGDSPLDLEMLKRADQAVVVVGDQHTRSESMETALSNAITNGGLHALQVVLPPTAPPRLDTSRLPPLDITKIDFINALTQYQRTGVSIHVATDKPASKLLATQMRNSAIRGPELRKVHKQAGCYLAHEYLSRIIGLEARSIARVLGRPTSGFMLANEDETTIMSLMRGGDPMASGVSKAFPQGMYVDVKKPLDIELHHLQGQAQVILVDSVVNTGKSIIECVHAIRKLDADIRIIIVAGVIQAQCLYRNSSTYRALCTYGHVDIVALRVSDTKFTGSGTTDTGNRLFNTTHLS
ncbi:hypothetical protein N0V83_006347 [Neocucurbitaria cava]|uniref:Phosphoribosyltransferase domain-containing protein n=1 Tax=Neocucurbitaria cava TaxID=798079 RepID=A0A9W8Y607_9PLEO|nr:hypothetical protein N0V83_006347 [Neocucurbitaria cava]